MRGEEEGISGNILDIDKKGRDVYISDLYYNGPENERKYFVVSISELIALVEKWEQLIQEKSDEIILSENNGKFELVGYNYIKNPTHEEVEG